ncbi:unnamed protein product [Arabidopsis arenosa]|uniref:Uncharacterized protein n=1 Tax=Arabidopsis arenosa TaxID=38785 RepID=A0A8S1ZM70_ARAAE|nr:unnamed protein product [Arabidopsis arenosa]
MAETEQRETIALMRMDDIVFVQAGRWILFSIGEWEFKMDSYQQERALRLMGLKSFRNLELKVRQLYKMERSSISMELSYMFEDKLALLAGVQPGPTLIGCDRQFRSFKSLSMDNKSVNLFVCFRKDARGNSRTTEEVGYFARLISLVQDNNTGNPPKSQLAMAQSTDVIDSSGGGGGGKWDISDDILFEALEAVEMANKGDLVVATGVNTSVAVDDEMESEDEDYFEKSDDSYCYSAGIESEDDDLDYENYTVGSVEDVLEIMENEDSGDDDFVEQPPKKKVRPKGKEKANEEMTDNLGCKGGVMTELLDTFQKGISIDEVYGYEDIKPMFGDDDMDRLEAHVDLSKEDDNMFVGRTFASREDFRIALSIYAINRIFRFKFTRKKISRTVGDIPIAVERELLKRFKGGLGMSVLAVRRTLVGEMHRLRMWSPTVQESILPVRDPSEVDVPEKIRVLCLMPPKTKRPPERPPKLPIHSVGEYESRNWPPYARRYRPFFERCLKAGNKTAIYYEELRVVVEGCDIKAGIDLLAQLVPEDGCATLACGVFSICDENEGMIVHYLELFGKMHAALGTEEVRRWGEELVEELVRDLRPYRIMSSNSYRKTFLYPISEVSRRRIVPWTAE